MAEIPQEAVEAAGKVLARAEGETLDDWVVESALEAAAPFLAAQEREARERLEESLAGADARWVETEEERRAAVARCAELEAVLMAVRTEPVVLVDGPGWWLAVETMEKVRRVLEHEPPASSPASVDPDPEAELREHTEELYPDA